MPVAHNKDFLVLYGSQTGQADTISEEIFDKACKQGFQPARFSLADVEKKVNRKIIYSNPNYLETIVETFQWESTCQNYSWTLFSIFVIALF